MSLFRREILSGYRTDRRIKTALDGTQLYNLDEFLEWYYNDVRMSPRNASIDRALNVAISNHERRQRSNDVLRLLPRICTLTGTVNKGYGVDGINALLSRNNVYDVIFAISPRGLRSKITTPSSNPNANDSAKINSVIGFIITELGECNTKPYVYSVNLICAIKNQIKGGLLMGAYLYCIKNSNPQVEQEGFLELAGGYTNIPGLISYMRMGFDKVNETCLTAIDNLPMSVNVVGLSNQIIIERAIGRDIRSIPNEESGIYNISSSHLSKPDKDLVSEELGKCNNLLYKIQMLTYARVVARRNKLSHDEQMLLDRIPNNDAGAIRELISIRQELLYRAYPRCKKGVCDQVMGWFGFNTNVGFGTRGRKNKKKRKGTRKNKPK